MPRLRPTRSVLRAVTLSVCVAASLLTEGGCAKPVHADAPEATSSSATPLATTPDARIAQSDGVAALLGPHPNERASAGAMFVAPAGTTIPDAIVAAGPTAVTGVHALDPRASSNPLLVLIAATPAQYRKDTGYAPGDQLAVTKTSATGLPYIVLAPRALAVPGSSTAKETLTHEAFHALTLEHLSVSRPLWLTEGWAEYVGQATVPQAPHRIAGMRPHLPSDAELRGPNGPDAYYVAFTFVRYLRDTYGKDATMAFYDDAVTTTTSTDALAQKHFHHTIAELTKGYQAWYPTFR